MLVFATVNGNVVGWDLRTRTPAWELKNDIRTGLITTMAVHQTQSWLALGTSMGAHVCWDLRFQLPITTISHPAGRRDCFLIAHTHKCVLISHMYKCVLNAYLYKCILITHLHKCVLIAHMHYISYA